MKKTNTEKFLTGEELINRYLGGSPRSNQLRNEIKEVVTGYLSAVRDPEPFFVFQKGIVGHLLQKEGYGNGSYVFNFKTPNGRWEILYKSKQPGGFYLIAEYQKYVPGGTVYSTEAGVKFSAVHVEEVRAALPVFVEGMITVFPEILRELQPILDAAPRLPRPHQFNPGPYFGANLKYCLQCGKLSSYCRMGDDCIPFYTA